MLLGAQAVVSGLAWTVWQRRSPTPRCCRHLGFPSPLLIDGSLALALPQQQVAFAAWHLFLEGGCQEGANLSITRLVCPRESLHEGGVCATWRGTPRPVLAESPLLTLQVSHRRAEICELGRGVEMMSRRKWRKSLRKGRGGVLFCPPGAALKPSCFSILLKEEGKRHLLRADCVSVPVL